MTTVILETPGDFGAWRRAVRALLAAGTPPEDVHWSLRNAGEALFDAPLVVGDAPPPLIPRPLVELAQRVICHRDAQTPARLYRLFWRGLQERQLLDRRADPDVDWAMQADKAIRRDIHKMHAFVRFRRIDTAGTRERFAAWFEPSHHILQLGAPFFQRRFFNMDWAIITPEARAIWLDGVLRYGPGGVRSEVPDCDVIEDQWRAYYGAIFNPARVKIGAMRAEMPKKYWHNLPEAQDIAALLAGADARVAQMQHASMSVANAKAVKWQAGGAAPLPAANSLTALAREVGECRRCPLHCHATQAVMGEGPQTARIMMVGEQPGDHEDVAGRPFVGPAGQLLDAALAEAGLDRRALYLTNAVKHFKFEPRGKRRIHQNPDAGEIDICRWWLDRERALIKPELIVTLGGSALRGVIGKTVTVASMRGAAHRLADGTLLLATVHPSYLLRLPDAARRAEAEQAFAADLRRAATLPFDRWREA